MQYAKGRLAEAYTGSSKTTDLGFSYTNRGEVATAYQSSPHSGGYYHPTATYWAQQGLLDTLNPNMTGIPNWTYTPDGEGRINTVSASAGQNPVTATSYNGFSEPTGITFGSGDADAFEYDASTGRMRQYLATIGGSDVSGGLTWNANGTLQNLTIIDPFNSGDSAVPVLQSSACLSCGNNVSGWRLVAAADFDGNGVPDLVYQNQSTGQVNVDYYGGAGGATFIGWACLSCGINLTGWQAVAAADFDGNGTPDLIYRNQTTGQVNVDYYGGAGGATFLGYACLSCGIDTSGWTVVAAADFDGNGVPDLVYQNQSTGQVNVDYYGGSGGATFLGWACLSCGINLSGWQLVAAADFNGDGVPDLVYRYQTTGQVNVDYYGGAGGATLIGWAVLNSGAGTSGWSVGAAADFNGNGVPDLVWQNQSTDQVNVNYYTSGCAYTYDDLARLSAANCGSVWAQTFSYDAFGNIGKSGSQSFGPTYSPTTNRYTAIGLVTPTYDNNGNLTYDGYHHYTWDGEGNLATLDNNGDTYDALNRRVERNNGSGYTEVVYGPAGNKLALMNGQTATKVFAPLSGGATAVYNSSGLQYYRHPDWLGSSRVASTPTRGLYYQGEYAPFGENYAETGTTDRNFTGQNQDMVPDLYDFLYREYHPIQGRWISPDRAGMAVADPTNPQSWDRYTYLLNNPLQYIDPLGLNYCSPGSAITDDQGNFIGYAESKCVTDEQYGDGTGYDGYIYVSPGSSATIDSGSPSGLGTDASSLFNDLMNGISSAVFYPGQNPQQVFNKYAARPLPKPGPPQLQQPPPGPPPEIVPPKGMNDVPWYKSVPTKIIELINSWPTFDVIMAVDPCIMNPRLGCGPYAPLGPA
jgi:RHS repeat-associated protein